MISVILRACWAVKVTPTWLRAHLYSAPGDVKVQYFDQWNTFYLDFFLNLRQVSKGNESVLPFEVIYKLRHVSKCNNYVIQYICNEAAL
jgi:hypothetical protein